MDDSDEWPDFKETYKYNFGKEPDEETLDILDCLAGIDNHVTIKPVYLPESRIDKYFDRLEDKLGEFKEKRSKGKTRVLSKNKFKLIK